jgi:hypothetical protein
MGRLLWREDGSVFYNVPYTIHLHFVCYYLKVYTIYTRSLSVQTQYSTSWFCKHTLVTQTRHGPHRKYLLLLPELLLRRVIAMLPSTGHPIVAYSLPRECLPSRCLAMLSANPSQYFHLDMWSVVCYIKDTVYGCLFVRVIRGRLS